MTHLWKLNWSETQDEPDSFRTFIWRNSLFDETRSREGWVNAALFVIRDLYEFDRERHIWNARTEPVRILVLRPGDEGIATDKTSQASDVSRRTEKLSGQTRDLKPAGRWSLVAFSILLASSGVLLIQEDHNWIPFQKPQPNTSEISTKQLRTVIGPGISDPDGMLVIGKNRA